MRKPLVLLMILSALLTACGENDDEISPDARVTDECVGTPTPIASPAALPSTFPNPVSVIYTSAETLGPTQVIEGYTATAFVSAYNAYKAALATGGYSVTKTEKEVKDAEVNYAGNGTSGQLKLEVECAERTSVRITVRPD